MLAPPLLTSNNRCGRWRDHGQVINGIKIHGAADGKCRPLSLAVTPGQRADCTQFEQVLQEICVPRPGPGRPRLLPDSVAAGRVGGNGVVRDAAASDT